MKEFLAVFLLLLATTSAHHDVHLLHADRFCANVTPEHNILLPSPLDCRIYYKCNNGMAIPQSCPDGLHWCQALTECLLPAIANCTIGHVPVTYPPGKEPSTLPPWPTRDVTCLEEGALFPDPSNCASYYECKKHMPSKKHCPQKQVFSVLIGSCVEADVAVCITDLKPNELCPVNDVRFVDPFDCSSYYECVNNSIETKECAPDMQYNLWFHLCASEELAHCQTYPTPKPTTMPSTTVKGPVPGQNLCPGNGYTLPNYQDCHSFWHCTGDTFVKDYCPPEFYYSCWDQKCLPSSSAQCEPQTGESCSTEGEKLPNPQDCHSYYVCKNGEVELEECSNGYEFNGWFSECVQTDRAHCSVVTTTSTVSTSSASTPTPSNTNDICPVDGAKLPDLNDCHSYYVCVTETPQRRQCPLNTIYSCWDQTCLPSTAGVCITNPNQVGQPCSNDNSTLPDVNDCGKYYVCENGSVQEKNCRSGLEYNKWYGECVTPNLAHCQHPTTTSQTTGPTETTTSGTSEPTETTTVSTDSSVSDITQRPCIKGSTSLAPNPLCQGPENSTLIYPDFTHCNQYMVCDCNRQLQTYTCVPINFHYNCETKKCENITHCCSPKPGPDQTEQPTPSDPPGSNTGEPEHSGSPGSGTEETSPSGPPGSNTGEPEHSGSPGSGTEKTSPSGPPGSNTGEPEHSGSPGSGTEKTSPSGSPGSNTGEPEHSGSPGSGTEETSPSGPPGSNTGEPEHSGSPGSGTEETSPSGPPGSNTGEPEHSGSPGSGTEETSPSGPPGSNTGEPEHSGSPGSGTEETSPSGPPGSNTGEPEHSGSPGSGTEETSPSGSPGSNTGEPEHSGSPGSGTEETSPSGPPGSNTGEPEHSGSPGSGTEETSPSGPPGSNTGEPEHSGSPGSGTEETSPSGPPGSNTGEPEHSGSPGSGTEETSPSGPPGSNTGEPEHSGSPGSGTEETSPSGPPGSNTGEPEHSGSPGSGTEETSPSGPPGSNTGEPEHSGSPGSGTEETSPSGPPGSNTGEPEHSGSPGSGTEETSPSGPPGSNTGEPEHSGSPGSGTEETSPSGPPGSNTGEPEHSGSPGSGTEETSPSGSPGSNTGEPEHSGSPGSGTEETSPSGPPGSNTGEPEHSGSPGSGTEETSPSGPPGSNTGEPEHSGSPGSGTEETSPSGSPGSNTEEPEHSGSPGSGTEETSPSGPPGSNTGEPEHSGSPGSGTEETSPSGPPGSNTGEPEHSGSPGSGTEETSPSGPPGSNTGEPGHPSVSTSESITNTPVPCHVDHSKPASPLCGGNNSSNFKYPAFGDCHAYQVCDCNNQLQKITCDPPEFNYNCEAKKCENITHCCAPGAPTETTSSTTVSTISSSKSTSSPELPTTCPLGLDGAKLPNPMDCKTYFTCDNGEIVIRPCPAGEMYSCWNQRCESPQDSSCINNPNIVGQNCSKAGQLLPNVANCKGYYECVNGHVQAKSCASGEMYNSWLATCVEYNASLCMTFPTVTLPPVTGPTVPPTSGPEYNTCPFDGALFPNLQDCNSYYECIGGVPVSQNCLAGYVYSCWDQKCTPPNNGTCVNQPEQQGDKCSIDGVRVSLGDCTSYYECKDGKIVLHKCPKGQQFNAAYLKCYPSKSAHCEGNTPLPTTLHPPTSITPQPGSDVCPIEGALLPNPLNCSTYYVCKNGVPTLELCVTGFQYSCWNQDCEPAGTAKCIADNPNQSNSTCKYNGQKTQNPEDCHTYYECENKVVVLKHCTKKTWYNKWFGICLPENVAHCKATTVPVPVTTSPKPTPTMSPKNDVCPYNGGLIPHPTDCTKYYQCVDYKPVERSCPRGQKYSCWDLKCKDARSAECINSGDQTGRPCSLNALHVPDIQNCATYYQCNNGIVEQRYCMIGFRYNKWYHECVRPPYDHCEEVKNTPSPTPTPTTTISPSTEYDLCPVDGAKLPDLVDCTKYYLCHNNTIDPQSCPDGQSYSCWDQKCEKDGEANCINYGVSQVGANCSIEGLRLSDVQNCSSYYECINGTVTQEDCPTGLQFNYKFQGCYSPEKAHCQVTPTITPPPPATTTTVTPNPVNDVCPNEGAMLPNPLNCSTFYKCIKGNPVLQECADGLEYSCWDQRCEPSDQANCISQPTTQTCTKNGARNADPTDCHKYFECVNGTIQTKTCEKWFYNKWFAFCVPVSDSAHCGPKVTVTPKHPPTVTTVKPGNTDSCPTNGARLPDPKDCTQYYECVKGKPTVKKCPHGKKYSYSDEECKKESEAQCINVGSPIGQTCKHEGLRVQNIQSCTSYYECIDGVIELQSCFLLFQYNRWYHSCQLTIFSHCQTYPTIAPPTTTAPAVTTKKYPGLSCTGHRKVADIKECNKYAVCEKKSVVVYNCRPGTNYDGFSQSCVAPDIAKCAAVIGKYDGQSCSKNGVTVPNPESCYSHYECKKRKITKVDCEFPRQYNIWTGKCEVVTLWSKCIQSLNI